MPTSEANELALRTSLYEQTSSISAAYEMSQFTVEDGSVSGSGVRAAFFHSFNQSFGLEVGASAAINNQGTVQNSFTGFTGFAYYNLFGQAYNSTKKIYLGDVLIATESQPSRHNIQVGAGISQYFLNGNKGVYSASGIGFGAIYKFHVWGVDLKVSARWSQLEAAQTQVDAMTYDAGVIFSL